MFTFWCQTRGISFVCLRMFPQMNYSCSVFGLHETRSHPEQKISFQAHFDHRRRSVNPAMSFDGVTLHWEQKTSSQRQKASSHGKFFVLDVQLGSSISMIHSQVFNEIFYWNGKSESLLWHEAHLHAFHRQLHFWTPRILMSFVSRVAFWGFRPTTNFRSSNQTT